MTGPDADTVTVLHGDCLDVLPGLEPASVDAVVTDPPYSLTFMGRDWDRHDSPSAFQSWCEKWARECLRVLKPGGHLLAFGGTRTAHRLVCGIEDAGFEIRDSIGHSSSMLAWCFGSGFPKSLNVSKDDRFCQRVPGLCDTATDHAAEFAAEVLLAEVRGDSEADPAGLKDLHGVPVHLYPDYAIPGRSESDLLESLRGPLNGSGERRQTVEAGPARDDSLRNVRRARTPLAESGGPQSGDVLHEPMRRESAIRNSPTPSVRPDGQEGEAPLRAGQSRMERRGDVQTAEGQLRRPAVCAVPAGPARDGSVGRLCDGAPSSHGVVDRPPADANGVRQPHRPEPPQQCSLEPGAVPVERGSQAGRGWPLCPGCGKPRIPAGLGTALKPSWEPVVVARKPLGGTVAANVQAFGTGALNIDACRVDASDKAKFPVGYNKGMGQDSYAQDDYSRAMIRTPDPNPSGRWPANVVLSHAATPDGGDGCAGGCVEGCPVAELDTQSGECRASGHINRSDARERRGDLQFVNGEGKGYAIPGVNTYADSGGASRFFPVFRYQAKAPTRERPKVDGIAHPTCKPLTLMRWLARLVTPPGGVILDPFAGSGTTAEACQIEGFRCIAIEREADYLPLIRARLDRNPQTVLL